MSDPASIDLIKRLAASLPIDHPLGGEVWYYLRQFPPCEECGAMTPQEAATRCHCSGDKDDCHGCDLWPDADAALAEPEPQPIPVSERPWEREGFCDAEGTCWAIGQRDAWCRVYVPGRDWGNPAYTHCLPAAALPLPPREDNLNPTTTDTP